MFVEVVIFLLVHLVHRYSCTGTAYVYTYIQCIHITELLSIDQCIEDIYLRGYLYKCDTVVGDNLTVPCGPYTANGTISFTFRNVTSDVVLLNDTRQYLQLNVTPFDNGIEVLCQSSAGNMFMYKITVDCKKYIDCVCLHMYNDSFHRSTD